MHGNDVSWWLEVSSAVGNGEMPPEDGPELTDEDRKKIVEWLSVELQSASQVQRAAQGNSSFRRMTRYEYNYALQDLLGLSVDFTEDLPPDPISTEGFENSSETLQITGKQYAEYLEINRDALHRATVSGQRPDELHWRVSAQQASARMFAEPAKVNQKPKRKRARPSSFGLYKNTTTGKAVPATWSYRGAVDAQSPTTQSPTTQSPTLTLPETPEPSGFVGVLPPKKRIVIELGNRLPDKGIMRVRVRASRVSDQNGSASGPAPSLALEFGWQGDKDQKAAYRISRSNQVIEASPGEPKFYQWDIPLMEIHPRNPVRKTGTLGTTVETNPSEYIRLLNTSRDSISKHPVRLRRGVRARLRPMAAGIALGDLSSKPRTATTKTLTREKSCRVSCAELGDAVSPTQKSICRWNCLPAFALLVKTSSKRWWRHWPPYCLLRDFLYLVQSDHPVESSAETDRGLD